MDISAISSLATSLSESRTSQDVSIAVLKTALDSEAQSASALIDAIPSPANLPPHLGQNINTTA
jgi:hypothetical protein